MAANGQNLVRFLAILVAVALGIYAVWSYAAGWAPSRDEYATQGISISETSGKANWDMLRATGVDFAYMTATDGTEKRDKLFSENLAGAKEAGVRFGAVHKFDTCRLAKDQATLFITTVPRDPNALPPAIRLEFSETCKSKLNRSALISELATIINQIATHTGNPPLLFLAKDFEQEYQLSKAFPKLQLWVEGTYFLPEYTARPWVMWTANIAREIGGIENPVGWVVVRN
ncbi:MAG: GH25 family lysozyme [Sphingorhabdus sp.]